MEKTFAMISLGCAKNLVNSEQMLYLMSEAGYTLVPDPEGADLAIVNTCGFIDAAKSEAIDNILEMAQLKKAGKLGGLIVTGCLAERYKDSIMSEMPEIDAVLGVGSFGDIVSAADAVMAGRCTSAFGDNSAPLTRYPALSPPVRAGHICASPRAATTSAPSVPSPLSAAATAPAIWRTSSRRRAISLRTASRSL